MAFVPGFDNDVFISYAHGDDREWINRFLDRLRPVLSRLLPGASVWIDKDDLRKSRNFDQDIPKNLESSAVLISLVSPTYIDRPYCVQHECRRFTELVASRKVAGQRFSSPEFAADLFALRCPILPMPDRTYWSLIPGATDLSFCGDDDIEPFPIGSPAFENRFRELLQRELIPLLRRMRNRSTPVLLYPRHPAPEIAEAHVALTNELSARSYLIQPDNELDPGTHVPRCELAVLLLGAKYDEASRNLVKTIKDLEKPLVAWPSPALENSGDPLQRGLFQDLLQFESSRKTVLSTGVTPDKLKQEVFTRLNPRDNIAPAAGGKPRVYLIYDSRQNSEKNNAGQIAYHYHDEFHFEYSDAPRQDTVRLTQSEGVLLVWGGAGEEWCAEEFDRMVRLASHSKSRGLCLFGPRESKNGESKIALAEQIRRTQSAIHVAEQFGPFDPVRLEPFFSPIRRAEAGSA
jgi:TIR domain